MPVLSVSPFTDVELKAPVQHEVSVHLGRLSDIVHPLAAMKHHHHLTGTCLLGTNCQVPRRPEVDDRRTEVDDQRTEVDD